MSPRLLAVMFVIAAAPVAAQPVGVATCDAFLTAYERCAASPGVPEAARPGMIQGIAGMRTSFRDAINGSERARPTLTASCAQTHGMVRERLVEAFRCDFPAPEVIVAAPEPIVRPSIPRPSAVRAADTDPQAQEIAKANAYTEIQNTIVKFHPMAKNLAQYQRNNERVLQLGTKLGDNAFYQFGISDFDTVIDRLEAAIARPAAVPEIDPAAARLLEALQAANPVIKALDRYQTTREFREDGYKFAQTQHPILVARMAAAIAAADTFGDALFDREVARDELRVETFAKNSMAQRLLATSLGVRRALRRYEALGPKADVGPFMAALANVSSSSRALDAVMDGMSPKPSSACMGYTRTLDSLIGYGRDVARNVKAGSDPKQPAERFGSYYNRSVEYFGRCQRDEERARS